MIYSERDKQIIEKYMEKEKLPNTYIPTNYQEKYINLSSINKMNYPFEYIYNCRNRGYNDKYEDIIIERISYDEEFAIISDYVVYGISQNYYYISNYGRVFSLFYRRFIAPYDREGQLRVALSVYDFNKKKYKSKHFPIHRLVMKTFQFIPNSSEYVVNHKDGNPYNNYIMNLEWCTQIWNSWHA